MNSKKMKLLPDSRGDSWNAYLDNTLIVGISLVFRQVNYFPDLLNDFRQVFDNWFVIDREQITSLESFK